MMIVYYYCKMADVAIKGFVEIRTGFANTRLSVCWRDKSFKSFVQKKGLFLTPHKNNKTLVKLNWMAFRFVEWAAVLACGLKSLLRNEQQFQKFPNWVEIAVVAFDRR